MNNVGSRGDARTSLSLADIIDVLLESAQCSCLALEIRILSLVIQRSLMFKVPFLKTFQNSLGVWGHPQPIIKGLTVPNTGKCILGHSYPMPSASKPLDGIPNDARKAMRDEGPIKLRRCQSGERAGA